VIARCNLRGPAEFAVDFVLLAADVTAPATDIADWFKHRPFTYEVRVPEAGRGQQLVGKRMPSCLSAATAARQLVGKRVPTCLSATTAARAQVSHVVTNASWRLNFMLEPAGVHLWQHATAQYDWDSNSSMHAGAA